jgi:cystathionine gamma-synthase
MWDARRVIAQAEVTWASRVVGEIPAALTHASTANPPIAVDPGLVRLSVGLAHVDDLIADLEQAMGG